MLAGSVCATSRKLVATQFGLTPEDILLPTREHRIVVPRQTAMYLARRMGDASLSVPLSYPTIGRHFGGLDHTTVMHALHATQLRALRDAHFADSLARLTAQADALVEQMRAFKIKDLPPRIPADVVCDLAGYGRPTLAKRIAEGRMPAPIDKARQHIFETQAVLEALGLAKPEDAVAPVPAW